MTLYLARYLLPVTAPPVEDGAMLARDGRIVAVGRRRDLQPGWKGETVDFGDAVILPPLVNCHTHLELTRFPDWVARAGETAAPGSFVDWILHLIRIKGQQGHDELRSSLEDGLLRSLQAGTGAVGDILSCPEALSAYRTSPLHGRFFLEILGVETDLVLTRLDLLKTILDGGPIGCLKPGLAPHAPYTLSAGALARILSVADCPLSIHFAESAEECEFLQRAAGAIAEKLYPRVGWGGRIPEPAGLRPTTWLDAGGLLTRKPLLVHGVHVSRDEADLLGRQGVTVVLCPRSNARLQVGHAPVEHYRAAGVSLALGTDSLASSPSLSIWDELAFADHLFGASLSPADLLAMATVNGARGLGLEGEMGALEPGWGEHFQVLKAPSWPPFRDLEALLVSRGGGLAGGHLFLAGRQVLQSN